MRSSVPVAAHEKGLASAPDAVPAFANVGSSHELVPVSNLRGSQLRQLKVSCR